MCFAVSYYFQLFILPPNVKIFAWKWCGVEQARAQIDREERRVHGYHRNEVYVGINEMEALLPRADALAVAQPHFPARLAGAGERLDLMLIDVPQQGRSRSWPTGLFQPCRPISLPP